MERTDTPDTSHLDSLQLNLSHERMRLAAATSEKERQLRTVWVQQIEREIAGERKFLGLPPMAENELSDDELLAELKG